MKTAIKLALVGATLLSTTAFANTLRSTTATTGGAVGSDLILFVSDLTTGSYFAYDTGVTLDTVQTTAASAAATTANGSTPISQTSSNGTLAFNGAGLNLGSVASFIASTASTDNVQWAIDAGDGKNTATTSTSAGYNRLLISSSLSQPSWANTGNTSIKSGVANLTGLIGAWNAQGNVDTSTTAGWGVGSYGNFGPHGFIGANPDSGAAIGSAQSLFLSFNTVNGGGSNPSSIEATSGTFTLNSNGSLTYTPSSTVVTPIPGAMWLLGSGLFGLVGVSRRRRV